MFGAVHRRSSQGRHDRSRKGLGIQGMEFLESRHLLAAVEYTQSLTPIPEYQVEWCTEGQDVRFRMTATGTGWVALGFNDRQRMAQSDIMMATGEGSSADTFADAQAAPGIDTVQNINLISFSQENGTTIVELSRPINTGDADGDYSLDTSRFLIWAYNERRDLFTSQHTDRGFSAEKINFAQAGACRPIGGGLPSITIADASIAEGNTATQSLGFAVTLSAAPTETVTVQYATSDGTAKAGEDYENATGTLTFAPGDPLTKTIAINLVGDETTEGDETFDLKLTSVQGATLVDDLATGTIQNDDVIPDVLTVVVTLAETDVDTPGTLAVALSHPSSFEVTVDYSFEAITATANSDFRGTAGKLTFPAGSTTQLVPFTLIGDDLAEAEESFRVRLASPVNAAISGAGVGLVSIIDDDQPVRLHPWLNETFREDVNGSGTVEPADALAVINDLNRSGARALPVPPVAPTVPPPYIDVNGDDQVSPIDALLVINYLNLQAEAARAARPALSAIPASVVSAQAVVDLVLASAAWETSSELRKKNSA